MLNKAKAVAVSAIALFTYLTDASPAVIAARAPPSGYTYRGCYTDIPGFRVLPVYIGSSAGMTLDKCAIACKNYLYFGAEQGNQCYCGNAIGTFPPPIPVLDSLCVQPCVGNTLAGKPQFDQICGGNTQISVYQKNAGTIPPVPATPSFYPIGCYSQAFVGAPLTEGQFTLPTGLTIQMCEALCAGYPYYGLYNGDKCTCGNAIQDGAFISAPGVCNLPCNGDASQTCGSSTNVNIYASTTLTECGNLATDLRVQNPGFENGVAFWTTATSTPNEIQWTAPMSQPFNGRRAARFVSKTSVAQISISQVQIVCPGAGYVLSIYSKQESQSGCTATVAYNGIEKLSAVGTATYTQSQSFIVSQDEAAELSISVRCIGTAALKYMYIDNVQLRPATAADSALFPVASVAPNAN